MCEFWNRTKYSESISVRDRIKIQATNRGTWVNDRNTSQKNISKGLEISFAVGHMESTENWENAVAA